MIDTHGTRSIQNHDFLRFCRCGCSLNHYKWSQCRPSQPYCARSHSGNCTNLARRRGARLFFCCGCAARFFCCGCAAGSLTHLLPAASEHPLQKGIPGPWRVFFCCGCASSGGARLFFCCGCAARLFFCCGCVSSLTHSLAARRPESTNSKKAHTTKTNTGSARRRPAWPRLSGPGWDQSPSRSRTTSQTGPGGPGAARSLGALAAARSHFPTRPPSSRPAPPA